MYERGSGSGSRYSSPLVRRERWVLAGECTREGEGLLVLLSGRELQGGAPGTHLPICHLEEGCILSRSYVIAVSIH